ncbi:GFA family protein [Streptomyces sp. NBC_01216]|uniref:GFA family protein n=1 Tax=Streptomyces sp. NBC_01216 TaxID=2903778 RepID=UPI002E10350A|nr:GFA family protein [Streptomyces sp. NBC_01216]
MPSSPQPRTGHCQCGNIQFTVCGEDDYVHLCSCEDCQSLSGGPVMSWVSFPLAGLKWTGAGGEPAWHYTWPDSRRGFCPNCVMQAEHVSRHVVSHGYPASMRTTGTSRGENSPSARVLKASR